MTTLALNNTGMIEMDRLPVDDYMAVFAHAAEVLLWSEVAGDALVRCSRIAAFAVTVRTINICMSSAQWIEIVIKVFTEESYIFGID